MVENRDNPVTNKSKKSGLFDWQDYASEGKGPGAISSSPGEEARQKLTDEALGRRSLSRVSNEESRNDPVGSAWSALGDGWNKSLNLVSGLDVEKKFVDNVKPELAQTFKRGKELGDLGYSSRDKNAGLTQEDRNALEVYEQIGKKLVNQMPFYEQNALSRRVEEGILEKAAAIEKQKTAEAFINAVPQGSGTGQKSEEARQVVRPDALVGAKLSADETLGATWDKARSGKATDAESLGAKLKEPTLKGDDWSAVPTASGRPAWLAQGAEQNKLFTDEKIRPSTEAYNKKAVELPAAQEKIGAWKALPAAATPEQALKVRESQPARDAGLEPAAPAGRWTDKAGGTVVQTSDDNARARASLSGKEPAAEPLALASRRDSAGQAGESRRQEQTPAPGQAVTPKPVDWQGGPRPSAQLRNERTGTQEPQASERTASVNTAANPLQQTRSDGQERGRDAGEVNRLGQQAVGCHPAAPDRTPASTSKAAPSAPAADTSGKQDLAKPRSAVFPETVTAREKTSTQAVPEFSGGKGERTERGPQAPLKALATTQAPSGVQAGQKVERPAEGLSRAARFIALEPGADNSAKTKPAGVQLQPDGTRQALLLAGRDGQEANRRVLVSTRGQVQDANRQVQVQVRHDGRDGRDGNQQVPAEARRHGRDGNPQVPAGSRPDTPEANRHGQAGSRRDGQNASRPIDAAAAGVGAQAAPPARLDTAAASGTGRVAALEPLNTFTIKEGRLPGASLVSASGKRYITGAEIALAAVVAAAGAARVRPEAKAGRAPDESLLPPVKLPSDVLLPQRQPVAGTTIPAIGAQLAPEKQLGSAQAASTGRLPACEASISVSANPAAGKRYITGAEMALAAVIAAAGSARLRPEPAIPPAAQRSVPGILPAPPGDSRVGNSKAGRNLQGNSLAEQAGARDRHDAAGCTLHGQACPSAHRADNLRGALDPHVDTTVSQGPRRNCSDVVLAQQRSGLEYQHLDEPAADRPAGAGSAEPPAAPAPRAPRTVLRRPTTLVSSNDTLVTIAEAFFHDANLAWLIADLNRDRLKESWIDGKRIVELRNRQQLDLPVWQDIAEFYRRRDAAAAPENIVTIVQECQVTRELLQSTLAPVLGRAPLPANVLLRSHLDVRPSGPPGLRR